MTATTDVSPRKVSFTAAARILADRDPVIAGLLAQTGPPRLSRTSESHFATLVRAIVYQQLAGRAAAAIHGRLIAALGGDVQPEGLIALSDETLRAVGLSRAKVASLRDLAAKVLDGAVVLSPRGLSRESDEQIIARLSAVRGIDPWTAEMFLLFQLRRWTCGRSATSASAAATAWPGRSRRRPRGNWNRSATRTGPTGRCWPGTAGGPPSCTRTPPTAP